MTKLNNSDGVLADIVRPTLGLTATFFGVTTVNTTGAVVLAANNSRQLGAWIQNRTATTMGSVGSSISNTGPAVGSGTSGISLPIFIPGTGDIYVKADSGLISVAGYWI